MSLTNLCRITMLNEYEYQYHRNCIQSHGNIAFKERILHKLNYRSERVLHMCCRDIQLKLRRTVS